MTSLQTEILDTVAYADTLVHALTANEEELKSAKNNLFFLEQNATRLYNLTGQQFSAQKLARQIKSFKDENESTIFHTSDLDYKDDKDGVATGYLKLLLCLVLKHEYNFTPERIDSLYNSLEGDERYIALSLFPRALDLQQYYLETPATPAEKRAMQKSILSDCSPKDVIEGALGILRLGPAKNNKVSQKLAALRLAAETKAAQTPQPAPKEDLDGPYDLGPYMPDAQPENGVAVESSTPPAAPQTEIPKTKALAAPKVVAKTDPENSNTPGDAKTGAEKSSRKKTEQQPPKPPKTPKIDPVEKAFADNKIILQIKIKGDKPEETKERVAQIKAKCREILEKEKDSTKLENLWKFLREHQHAFSSATKLPNLPLKFFYDDDVVKEDKKQPGSDFATQRENFIQRYEAVGEEKYTRLRGMIKFLGLKPAIRYSTEKEQEWNELLPLLALDDASLPELAALQSANRITYSVLKDANNLTILAETTQLPGFAKVIKDSNLPVELLYKDTPEIKAEREILESFHRSNAGKLAIAQKLDKEILYKVEPKYASRREALKALCSHSVLKHYPQVAFLFIERSKERHTQILEKLTAHEGFFSIYVQNILGGRKDKAWPVIEFIADSKALDKKVFSQQATNLIAKSKFEFTPSLKEIFESISFANKVNLLGRQFEGHQKFSYKFSKVESPQKSYQVTITGLNSAEIYKGPADLNSLSTSEKFKNSQNQIQEMIKKGHGEFAEVIEELTPPEPAAEPEPVAAEPDKNGHSHTGRQKKRRAKEQKKRKSAYRR